VLGDRLEVRQVDVTEIDGSQSRQHLRGDDEGELERPEVQGGVRQRQAQGRHGVLAGHDGRARDPIADHDPPAQPSVAIRRGAVAAAQAVGYVSEHIRHRQQDAALGRGGR